MNATRILMIDDHEIFRRGLSMLLDDGIPGVELFEAGSISEAIQNAPDQLDAILLDIKLPGVNGVNGMVWLKRKWPSAPILVLSSRDEPETVRMALAQGASSFISKADAGNKIVAWLNQVLCREHNSPADEGRDTKNMQQLTPRQCEVLELLCAGLSNKTIARQLELSENTVRGHVQAILVFLQVTSRSEAAFEALRRGLIG